MSENERYWNISIHAPTQGATLICAVMICFRLFQSTLPRKERPFSYCPTSIFVNFNPRSHARSDTKSQHNPRRHQQFQSTLPRKERQEIPTIDTSSLEFQSTLPRKERPIVIRFRLELVQFQSTLPRKERRR